jgi:hypothetical protein
MAAAFLAEGLNAQFEAQVEPAKICQLGVSPTKVRKVPQDSCQLPWSKGF